MEDLVRCFNVAAAQMKVVTDPHDNVQRVKNLTEQAADARCSLVVFPECSLTGYVHETAQEARSAALEEGHPALTECQQIADAFQSYLVVGYLERANGTLFNTGTLFGPNGFSVSYRKAHIPFLSSDRFVSSGEMKPVVAKTALGNIGMSICYDLRFPEWSRSLALEGAEIIVNPTNWARTADVWSRILPPARAFENGVYLISANRGDSEGGQEYIGRSSVVDPSGSVIEGIGREDQLVIGRVDRQKIRPNRFQNTPGERPYLADRKPELYWKDGCQGTAEDLVDPRD